MILSHIITSAILILFIIAIRALSGHRMSQRLRYALWLAVAVKLLIPIPFSNTFNIAGTLLPDAGTPAIEESSVMSPVTSSGVGDASDRSHRISDTDTTVVNHHNPDVDKKNVMEDQGKAETPVTNSIEKNEAPVVDFSKTESLDQSTNPSGITWKTVLLFVWIAGVILVLAFLIQSNVRFARRLRRSRVYHDRYENRLRVYVSDEVGSPCLYGLIRPCIYLPTEDYSEETYNQILLHEWNHYKHADMIWGIVRALCVSLYWFHPLVWIAATLSLRDSELACDESVLIKMDDEERRSYGYMLLDLCENTTGRGRFFGPLLTTEMLGGSHEMKDRIVSISKYKKHSKLLVVVTLIMAMSVVGCTYGTSAEETKTDTPETTASSESVSGSAATAKPENEDTFPNEEYMRLFAEYLIKNSNSFKLENGQEDLYVSLVCIDEPVLLVSIHTINDGVYDYDCAIGAMLFGYSKEKGTVVEHTVIHSTGSGYPLMIMDGSIVSGFNHWSDSYRVSDGIVIDERYEGWGYDKKTGTHTITQINNMDEKIVKEEELPIKEVEKKDAYAEASYRGSILPFFKIDRNLINENKTDEIVETLKRSLDGGMELVDQETVFAEKTVLKKVEHFIGEAASFAGLDENESKTYKWKKGKSNGDDIYLMLLELLPAPTGKEWTEEKEKTYGSFPGFRFRFSGDKLISMQYVIGNRCLDDLLKSKQEVYMQVDSYTPPSTDVFSNMDMIVKYATTVAGKKSVLGADDTNPTDIASLTNKTIIYPSDSSYEYIENRTKDTGNTYLAYEDTDGATYIWDATNQMMVSYSSGD